MGMSLFMFISSKQVLYNVRTFLLCKGSADFFKVFKREFDFAANNIITTIPLNHIPNRISPIIDGVLLLTDNVKSFICFVVLDTLIFPAVSATVFIVDDAGIFSLPSHKKICEN